MKVKLVTAMVIALFLVSMLNGVFVAPVAGTPDSGLVGQWSFEEGIGSTASDSSGNANHGTLSGGKFGNALYFDGDDDYVLVYDSDSLDVTTFTFEAWIYPISYGPSDWPRILHKGAVGSQYEFDLSIYSPHPNSLAINLAGTPYYSLSNVILLNQWQHVAVTCDGLNVKFYVNNVLINTISTDKTAPINPVDLYIGNRFDLQRDFHGIIDEVRISNITRASFDLITPPSADEHTVALWHFDESVGSIAHDETTNDNDGTIVGAKWAGPTWVSGKYGNALYFDGVYTTNAVFSDYVKVPSPLSLYLTDEVTAEMWIKPTGIPDRSYGDAVRLGYGYELCLRPDGKLEVALYRGSWGWWDSIKVIPIPASDFYHVMFTYDSDGGADNLKIYINGELDAQYTVGSGALLSSGDFWISPWFWPFEGIIDEVRIWNVVLPFKLEFLDSSTSLAPVNTDAPLTVRLTDSDGDPVGDVEIMFSSDAPSGTSLSFNPNPVPTGSDGCATVQAKGTTAGVYTVTVSATTPLGPVTAMWILVLYDPSAGFVTGGGWIWSPKGAYAADPTLEGKATFGFVSKYQKGANVPTGNTEFQFHTAGLNFKSTIYEWLVVAGTTAQFKGTGTINGQGNYKFMLWARDGGKTGADMFRIKIWEEDNGNENVIYDNGAELQISGGSIIIHK